MITLFVVFYMLPEDPNEQSLKLALQTFETREACLQYRDSDDFATYWTKLEGDWGVRKFKMEFGCASEENL